MNSIRKQGFRKVIQSAKKQTNKLEILTPTFKKRIYQDANAMETEDTASVKEQVQQSQDNSFLWDESSQNTLFRTPKKSKNRSRLQSMETNNLNIFYSGNQDQTIQQYQSQTKTKLTRSRKKQKSLSVLALKFLEKFAHIDSGEITLSQIINQLKVEKRRIYDVVNILEAFKVIYKTEKNCYNWRGIKSIEQTLSQYATAKDINNDLENQDIFNLKGNKNRMLTTLSAKFIKYFLENPGPITLEQAATAFCSKSASQGKIKTKIRRLYDISNVFIALGIIEKQRKGCKKPSYYWKGLSGFQKIQTSIFSNLKKQERKKERFIKVQNQKIMQKKGLKISFENKIQNMFKNVIDDKLTKHISLSVGIPIFRYKQINNSNNPIQNYKQFNNTNVYYDTTKSTMEQEVPIKRVKQRGRGNPKTIKMLKEIYDVIQNQESNKSSFTLIKRKRGKASFESQFSQNNQNIPENQLFSIKKQIRR